MPADSAVYEQLKARLKMRLVDLMDGASEGPRDTAQRQALQQQLRRTLKTITDDFPAAQRLSDEQGDRLLQEVLEDALGFGPLEPLLADPTITEIMVNDPARIFVERDGRVQQVDAAFRDIPHLMAVIERMLSTVNQTVNEAAPLCDATLQDGSRVNVIIPPLAFGSPVLTLRRRLRDWTMDDFLQTGALSPEAAEFLKACILAKVNMVICGGTSTGKTTLLSILSASIPPEERIITIENVLELQLYDKPNWVRLSAKTANLEGRGEVPLRTLVRNALRMRPDRIILGEARGGEALDVVQAMHLGHDGFMTAMHANSPHAALERLETLMLMSGLDVPPMVCRMQIASAVDLVVHMGRFADGARRISAIAQVMGTSKESFVVEDLFVFDVHGFSPEGKLSGAFRYTGAAPKFLEKFRLNNVSLPAWVKTQ